MFSQQWLYIFSRYPMKHVKIMMYYKSIWYVGILPFPGSKWQNQVGLITISYVLLRLLLLVVLCHLLQSRQFCNNVTFCQCHIVFYTLTSVPLTPSVPGLPYISANLIMFKRKINNHWLLRVEIPASCIEGVRCEKRSLDRISSLHQGGQLNLQAILDWLYEPFKVILETTLRIPSSPSQ